MEPVPLLGFNESLIHLKNPFLFFQTHCPKAEGTSFVPFSSLVNFLADYSSTPLPLFFHSLYFGFFIAAFISSVNQNSFF